MELWSIACNLLWLHNSMIEFGFEHKSSISMHCNNQSAIYITKNLMFHDCTQHIEVDCHLVKDYFVRKVICTPFTSSSK